MSFSTFNAAFLALLTLLLLTPKVGQSFGAEVMFLYLLISTAAMLFLATKKIDLTKPEGNIRLFLSSIKTKASRMLQKLFAPAILLVKKMIAPVITRVKKLVTPLIKKLEPYILLVKLLVLRIRFKLLLLKLHWLKFILGHPKLALLMKKLTETPNDVKKGVKLAISKRDYRLFALVYFVQGILGLSGLAFTLFLDGVMKLSVAQITTLFSITTIPWVIKPLYGMISDSYPLFKGLRRKPYIIICCTLASIGWLIVIMGAFEKSYLLIILGMLMEAVGVAMTDVVIDGLAVQKSPNEAEAKNIQNVCWGSRAFGALIAGFLGGWLLQHFIGWPFNNGFINVFALTMFLPLVPLTTAFFVDEEPVKANENKGGIVHSLKVLGNAVNTEKRLLIAALFIFLWNMTPSFGTPFLLFMKKQLGFSETFIGTLSTISSAGSLFGMMLYGLYFKATALKRILKWTIWIGAASTFMMFLVINPTSAMIIWLVSGVIGYIAFIPTMALAVRATPKDAEASVYALLMSIANLGGVVATFTGGQLYELIGMKALITLSAVACLIPLLILKYWPDSEKEGEGKKINVKNCVVNSSIVVPFRMAWKLALQLFEWLFGVKLSR
ncbi:MAG: MFS transporter [Nanoarchaeota archaeon]|nr:MFS transporter [Nanoarchaeota archaeon]